jgi:glycosyltransferase involved in cell wall biosynthesis
MAIPGRKIHVGYVVSHPIHYQAPLLRRIASTPDIHLTVLYSSDQSLRRYRSNGFAREVHWSDIDLLSGYRHIFLPGIWKDAPVSDWRPFSYGLGRIIRQQRFDVLWVHSLGRATSIAAIGLSYLHGVPVLVRDEANEISRVRGAIKNYVRTGSRHLLYSAISGFLAIGTLNRRQYLADGVEPRRIFDMPYAVDNDDWQRRIRDARGRVGQLRQQFGLEPDRPVILTVARLAEQKGHMSLFEAWRELKRTTASNSPYLILVGDGPLRDRLTAAASGLSDIRFAGFKSQTELAAFYALAGIFVLPSLWESWGLVINEAMNAGCPIVASDKVGSAHDLLRDGTNGFRFEAGNARQLAAVLRRLLESSARRAEMRNASLHRIRAWSFDEDISGLRTALSATLSYRTLHSPLPQS